MGNVNILVAFFAGLASFLSPCALSMMPGYLGYLTGLGVDEEKTGKRTTTLVTKSLIFTMGFSMIFIVMGLSVTALGKFILSNKLIFNKIAGILIIIFGIHTTGVFKFKIFNKQKNSININWRKRNLGPFFLGIAFGAGWSPCVGPILASILLYAGSSQSLGKGFILLIFYSLGLAIPFILSAFLVGRASEYFIKLKKYSKVISIISGLLLIIMGVLMYTNKLVYLNSLFV